MLLTSTSTNCYFASLVIGLIKSLILFYSSSYFSVFLFSLVEISVKYLLPLITFINVLIDFIDSKV